jgi:3D (Asp-Asp-Asp) domain-containing protein
MYDKQKIAHYILVGLCAYCTCISLAIAKEYFFGETFKNFTSQTKYHSGNISITEGTNKVEPIEVGTTSKDKLVTGRDQPVQPINKSDGQGIGGTTQTGTHNIPTVNGELDSKKIYPVFVTSYNPVQGQTDSSPCIGASGKNQCELAKTGIRMIALSQDLVGRVSWKPFTYGDTIVMKSDISDDRCNGEFLVVDTMNARFKNRADLFFMDRKDNISCQSWIWKKL